MSGICPSKKTMGKMVIFHFSRGNTLHLLGVQFFRFSTMKSLTFNNGIFYLSESPAYLVLILVIVHSAPRYPVLNEYGKLSLEQKYCKANIIKDHLLWESAYGKHSIAAQLIFPFTFSRFHLNSFH